MCIYIYIYIHLYKKKMIWIFVSVISIKHKCNSLCIPEYLLLLYMKCTSWSLCKLFNVKLHIANKNNIYWFVNNKWVTNKHWLLNIQVGDVNNSSSATETIVVYNKNYSFYSRQGRFTRPWNTIQLILCDLSVDLQKTLWRSQPVPLWAPLAIRSPNERGMGRRSNISLP